MVMNKKIYSLIILLLLIQFVHSFTFNDYQKDSWTVNYADSYPMTGIVATYEIDYSKGNNYVFPRCWVKLGSMASNNQPNGVNITRSILLDIYDNPITTIGWSPSLSSGINYLDPKTNLFGILKNSHHYSYISLLFDDNLSNPNIFNLCPSDKQLMVTWYGGSVDYYNQTNTNQTPTGNGYQGILKNIRDNLKNTDENKSYMCFSTTNNLYNASFDISKTGATRPLNYSQFMMFSWCEGINQIGINSVIDGALVSSQLAGISLNDYRYIKNTPPQGTESGILWKQTIFAAVHLDWISTKILQNELWYSVYGGLATLLNDWQTFLTQQLPEPIPSIIKTINEFFNLIIIILSFWFMKQVFTYFLSFRKAIKSSLTKASIIFSQMAFWLVVLIIFFYALVHTATFCGLKTGVVVYTLKLAGFEFKVPTSILDVGAWGWDALYLTTVSTSISDCGAYYKHLNPDMQITTGQVYTDTMNLSDPNISIFLRFDAVLILVFIIIIFIGTLWELFRNIFNRVKKMENEIRRPDEEEVEELEEE